MSLPMEDRFDRSAGVHAAEETLRMIASLPAPAGLEDRVKAAMRSAPRRGVLIAWPLAAGESWLRAAAAAAIVLTVAGGGWGVYSHIQVAPVPSALAEPQSPNGAGHFSTAGAMRVPQTVEGPAVAAPVVEKQMQGSASESSQRHEVKKKAKAATPASQLKTTR